MTDSAAIQLPEAISITCRADGVLWADAFARLTLRMRRKNDIHLVVGPSGLGGGILVARVEMEADAEAEVNAFMMDYVGVSAFSGEIIVSPLDVAGLEAAMQGYKMFHAAFAYPQDFLTHLQTAIKRLQHLAPSRLSVEVTAQGTNAEAVHIRAESLTV